MSRVELREYNSWFHSMIPHRIAELRRALRSSPGFEAWNSDYTPASLEQLGAWFQGQVTTRRRTPEEIDEIRTRLVFSITLSDVELTNQTLSLAMDVGMYTDTHTSPRKSLPNRTDSYTYASASRTYLSFGDADLQRSRIETKPAPGAYGNDWREAYFDGLGPTRP
jgi:hypothetical protein